MGVLQRSTKLDMPLEKAQRCWKEFSSKTGSGVRAGNGKDPGTVYFTKVDDATTEMTIQLDPTGPADDDESALNEQVDSVMEQFERFVENR